MVPFQYNNLRLTLQIAVGKNPPIQSLLNTLKQSD